MERVSYDVISRPNDPSSPTLADYLAADLRLLSVGINPSPRAVREGFYFPNPRNRFWPALNASGLLASPVTPGPDAMALILARDRIGFTDVAKRPSTMAGSLRAADYRAGAGRLTEVVANYRPGLVWFHGMTGWRNYLRYAGNIRGACAWGLQQQRVGEVAVFVTPNPSPANARFSLTDLIDRYRELAALLSA